MRARILEYGSPIVRARREYQDRVIAADRTARSSGVEPVVPEVADSALVASLLAEVGLGLALGGAIALLGGLGAAIAGRATRVVAAKTRRGGIRKEVAGPGP